MCIRAGSINVRLIFRVVKLVLGLSIRGSPTNFRDEDVARNLEGSWATLTQEQYARVSEFMRHRIGPRNEKYDAIARQVYRQ